MVSRWAGFFWHALPHATHKKAVSTLTSAHRAPTAWSSACQTAATSARPSTCRALWSVCKSSWTRASPQSSWPPSPRRRSCSGFSKRRALWRAASRASRTPAGASRACSASKSTTLARRRRTRKDTWHSCRMARSCAWCASRRHNALARAPARHALPALYVS